MTKTFPSVGSREDGLEFSNQVKDMYNSFKISTSISADKNKKILKLSGGDPLKYKSFPLCKKYLLKALKNSDIYKYPEAAGNEKYRNMISKYLLNEGFNSGKNLDLDNVIVTLSTTHGFKMILDVIVRPYDVIIVPSPTYGLFAYFPERINAQVRFIDLHKADNYYINPDRLEKRIDEINLELENKYKGKLEYVPRVIGFLNQNPHNPTGIVMGKNNISLINRISKICKDKKVWVIDDLVYRDLVFNTNDIAIPMALNSEYFDNTISLMGLSKCYGYASARAGIIVANKKIISLIRDNIFQHMDSIPILQCAMLAGAFNTTLKRYKDYKKYFSKLNKEYEYRYLFVKCLIDGVDSLDSTVCYNFNKQYLKIKIKNDIVRYASSYKNAYKLMEGIKGVELLKDLNVSGGFFALLDYTNVKGKKDTNGNIINSDIDLYKYLYEQYGIKVIMGSSIGYSKYSMICRITFALDIKDIVEYLEHMDSALQSLS